jgi:hypothetical protein
MIADGWASCYTIAGLLLVNIFIQIIKSDLNIPNLRGNNRAMIASDGDIRFGFSTPVHYSSDNMRSCDIMRMVSCTAGLQSMQFALRDLNRRTDILPNITVGFVAVDDCGTPIRALEVSTYFVNTKSADNSTNCGSNSSVSANAVSNNVVAIVGPFNSAAASLCQQVSSACFKFRS